MSQDPIHAVLVPPDLSRFRELTGVGHADLEVSFDGWSKLAVLTRDRVFLFPRWGRDAPLLYGARVCEVLSALGVRCVPRVLGRWPEGALSTGPFVAFERRSGTDWSVLEGDAGLAEVERMLQSLGGVIATWHRIPASSLPSDLRSPASLAPRHRLGGFLDPARVDGAVEEVTRLLRAPARWASSWRTALRRLSAMAPVLVHGDVCENQLLVDGDGRVDTVLDWDTARVGHPLLDFDFGEWGVGIFGWEAQFARLRRAMWEGYRAGRLGVDLPNAEEVHLLFTLSELAYFEQQSLQGPMDNWGATRLARCRAAIGRATEAILAGGTGGSL